MRRDLGGWVTPAELAPYVYLPCLTHLWCRSRVHSGSVFSFCSCRLASKHVSPRGNSGSKEKERHISAVHFDIFHYFKRGHAEVQLTRGCWRCSLWDTLGHRRHPRDQEVQKSDSQIRRFAGTQPVRLDRRWLVGLRPSMVVYVASVFLECSVSMELKDMVGEVCDSGLFSDDFPSPACFGVSVDSSTELKERFPRTPMGTTHDFCTVKKVGQ